MLEMILLELSRRNKGRMGFMLNNNLGMYIVLQRTIEFNKHTTCLGLIEVEE